MRATGVEENESINHNVELDNTFFDLPVEVKKLTEKS